MSVPVPERAAVLRDSRRNGRLLRAAIGGVIIVMAVRSVLRHWDELPSFPIIWRIQAPVLAQSAAIAIGSCVALALGLFVILRGWRQPVGLFAAVGIWARCNLLRYRGLARMLPRMTALAERARVSGTVSAGAVILPGIVALAMGGVAGIVLTGVNRFGALGMIAIAAYLTAAALLLLPLFLLTPTTIWSIGVRFGRPQAMQPVEPESLGAAIFTSLIAWAGFGLAMQLLAQGTLAAVDLPWPVAAGAFALGDVFGMVFLLLPGGLGVREGVFFVLLKNSIGVGPALVVALLSRVLMTLVEIVIALPYFVRERRET